MATFKKFFFHFVLIILIIQDFPFVYAHNKTTPGNPKSSSSSASHGHQESSSSSQGHHKSSSSSHGYHESSSSSSHAQPNASFNTQADCKDAFSKIYAFGGSYTDTGNAFLTKALKSFFGSSNSKTSSGSNSGSRLCDGELVIDYISQALGIPPPPPYKNASANFSSGANFAISGATALPSNFFSQNYNIQSSLWKAIPLSIDLQTKWFNEFLQYAQSQGKSGGGSGSVSGSPSGSGSGRGSSHNMDDALFWIGAIGATDYGLIGGTSSSSSDWLANLAVNITCNILKQVIDAGAKYIVVQGLPPLGCLPLQLSRTPQSDRDSNGCSSSTNSAVNKHNEQLQQQLSELQKEYKECVIIFADFSKAYLTILSHYGDFHFVEAFRACCGFGGNPLNFDINHPCGSLYTLKCANAGMHMVWDGIHFTAEVNRYVAKMFLSGNYTTPCLLDVIKKKKGM